MNDPSIQNLERPIYEEESEEFGTINLDENRFNIGVYFNDADNKSMLIPANVGRIVFSSNDYGEYNPVDC